MRNDGVGAAAAAGYAGASAGAGADGGDDAGAGGAAAGVGADAGAVHADANGQLLNCVAVLAQHGLAAESALVWFCFGAGINISHNGGGFSSRFANAGGFSSRFSQNGGGFSSCFCQIYCLGSHSSVCSGF